MVSKLAGREEVTTLQYTDGTSHRNGVKVSNGDAVHLRTGEM